MSKSITRKLAIHLSLGLMIFVANSANASECVPNSNDPICFAESSSALISWAPATGPVANYEVFTSRNEEEFSLELTTAGPETQVVLNGAINEMIRVQVRACDASASCGPFSEVSNGIQMQSPPAALGTESDHDFNGDGYPDLLWRNGTTGELAVWAIDRGNSTDLGTIAHGYSSDWQPVARIDFNQDGYTDLLWRNEGTGENQVLLLERTTVLGTLDVAALETGWVIGCSGDFNGDGSPDLFWRNTITGEAMVWYMDQNIVLGTRALSPLPVDQWRMDTVSGDLNNDGLSDIVVRHSRKGIAIGILMLPNGFTGILLSSIRQSSWDLAGAQDLDGDGIAELIWSKASGSIQIWAFEIQENSSFTLDSWHSRLPRNSEASTIQAMGDYDGDGLLELILCDASTGSHYIYQLTPEGGGENITEITVGPDPNWAVMFLP